MLYQGMYVPHVLFSHGALPGWLLQFEQFEKTCLLVLPYTSAPDARLWQACEHRTPVLLMLARAE